MKSYIKEVTARITGDAGEVIAQKNYRKATTAAKQQKAALESKIVDLESTLEETKEALQDAKYPVVAIKDNTEYIRNIKNQQDRVDKAQDDLADASTSLIYWESLYDEFEKDSE